MWYFLPFCCFSFPFTLTTFSFILFTQLFSLFKHFSFFCFYRKDSTIVAPYEKWEYYDQRIKQMEQDRNFAQNKTKKVAWFVSNCGARNGRLNYAHELQKHIQVS